MYLHPWMPRPDPSAIPLGGALASLRSVLIDLKSQAATLRFRRHHGALDYAVHSVEDVNSLLAARCVDALDRNHCGVY